MDLPREHTMAMSFIGSPSTFKDAINDLGKWELIEVIFLAKNQHQATKVRFACSYMNQQDTSNELATTSATTSASVSNKKDINKETIKQIEEGAPPLSPPLLNSPTKSVEKEKSKAKRGVSEVLPHHFRDSPCYEKQTFIAQLAETDYKAYDLAYYHETVKNWADSANTAKHRKTDWIATAKGFMLRDVKDGNAKMNPQFHSPPPHAPSFTPRLNSATPD